MRDGRVAAVSLIPRRPDPVERLAVGRTSTEAIRLFASLFSLCPEAHCLAASQALAAAAGMAMAPGVLNRQEARRELEIIKEHTLNLLLQQPAADSRLAQGLVTGYSALRAALGGPRIHGPAETPPAVDTAAAQAALDAWEKMLQALCGEFWRWPDPDLDALQHWQARRDSPAARLLHRHAQPGWPAFGRCTAALLPPLPPACLESWLSGQPAELATPTWEGRTRETGSYARQAETPLIRDARAGHGNGLYTRTLARLVELKALFHSVRLRLAHDATPASPRPKQDGGTGLAQTEASRGRLIHRAELARGRVSSYRILAPTEWNFHPLGLLNSALTGVPATTELPAQIDALLRAVDPCVDFRLTLDHA